AALSGVAFGAFALAGRLLPDHHGPAGLAGDPLLWAAVAYVVLGLGLYGVALERGSVTAVAATTVATEAVVPAAIGLLFLADRTRPGMAAAGFVGFVLTVGAGLALSRSRPVTAPESRG
ncbi:MAG TPA: hypothetical protein VHL53_19435, partial [Acidimicrobiia bacterium]|nr:hypothetical protein [Acidimicrobiia bacterium]